MSKRYQYRYERAKNEKESLLIRGSHRPNDETVYEYGPLSVPAANRPLLVALLRRLKRGDALVCSALHCLGRDATDILVTLKSLEQKEVRIYCGQLWLDNLAERRTPAAVTLKTLKALSVIEWHNAADRRALMENAAGEHHRPRGRPAAAALRTKEAVDDIVLRSKSGETITSIASSYDVHRGSVERVIKRAIEVEIVRSERLLQEEPPVGRVLRGAKTY